MGAVERLVAKMQPNTNTDEVSLAQVWIPPHPSSYLGKPTHVDGHWAEVGSLQSDQLKALNANPIAKRASELATAAEKKGGGFFEGGWQWKRSPTGSGIFGDTKDTGYGGATFTSTSKAALIQPTAKGFQVTIAKRSGKVSKVFSVDSLDEALKRGESEIRSLGDKLKKRGPTKWAPQDRAGGKGGGVVHSPAAFMRG